MDELDFEEVLAWLVVEYPVPGSVKEPSGTY